MEEEEEDFRSRVERERPYLLRYAGLQLRDPHAAEDAVQETLLAALAGEAGFGARASLRTWLTGILKHKIVGVPRAPAAEDLAGLHDARAPRPRDQRDL
jgi:DNA-directed RNA polymerase specialized sigma24 family protein